MTRYSWPVGSQNEASIAGGRLAEQLRARVGLSGWALDASVYAGLAELLATSSDFFNVKGHGAVGDNSRDDTEPVRAAATAAMALDNNDEQTIGRHGVLYFPPGHTYKIDGIVVPAGSTLHIIAHGAKIVVEGANKAIEVNGTEDSRSGLIVEGGLWIGDNTSGSVGIDLNWCTTACAIKGVVLRDFDDGLVVVDTHSGVADDLRVFSCVSRGVYLNGHDGTEGVFGWQFMRPYITNNTIGVLMRGTVVDVVFNGGQIRANGTNELQIYGTTSGGCNGNRFVGVHFERAFTAPQATVACDIGIESSGTRPNGTLFTGCQWSGQYTTLVEVGQAISTFFVDCQNETAVTTTVKNTHANSLNTRVVRWIRPDLGQEDLATGRGQVDAFTLSAGDNDDFSPDSAGSTSETLHLSANAAGSNLTGLTRGVQGRRIRIVNTSANLLTIVTADTGSTEANRFRTTNGANIALGLNEMADAEYDATVDRWRVWKVGRSVNGTATVANGATTSVVTHGLPTTPDLQDISVTPTNNMGNAAKFWISTPTATQFTINVDADPGAGTATFVWTASVQ